MNVIFLLCLVSSALWVGLAFHFLSNWKARRNPVSLGLAAAFGASATWAPSWWWFTRAVDPAALMLGGAVSQTAIALVIYGCLWLAKHKFPGTREGDRNPPA